MTAETLVLLIGTMLGSSTVTALIASYTIRKKTKAETDNIATDVYEKLITRQNDESVIDKEEIKFLRERDKIREEQFNECRQLCIVLQARLTTWEKKMKVLNIDFTDIPKVSVFVLDDEDYVLDIFNKKLELLPHIVVDLFGDIDSISTRIAEEPQCLILDYRVHGKTIDEFLNKIIKMKRYNPKIILISGMPLEQFQNMQYKPIIWHYFSKDEDYINKSVNRIMEYVNEIIK